MIHLPITLTIAAAATLTNLWLMIRVAQVRGQRGISVGDGGDEAVIRRMRAHANFIENAPIALILIGVLEATGGSSRWLWLAGIAFILARIAHGLGMDGGAFGRGRSIGTTLSMVILLGLALAALARSYGLA